MGCLRARRPPWDSARGGAVAVVKILIKPLGDTTRRRQTRGRVRVRGELVETRPATTSSRRAPPTHVPLRPDMVPNQRGVRDDEAWGAAAPRGDHVSSPSRPSPSRSGMIFGAEKRQRPRRRRRPPQLVVPRRAAAAPRGMIHQRITCRSVCPAGSTASPCE